MIVGLVMVLAGNLLFAFMLFGQVQTLRDILRTQHVISVAAVLILIGLQMILGALVLAVIGNEPARESREPS
jgi:hypothetical protein